MPRSLTLLPRLLLLLLLFAGAARAAAPHSAMAIYYRRCVNDTTLSLEKRFAYADSLAAVSPGERLELQYLKARLAFHDSRYVMTSAPVRELMKHGIGHRPLWQQCEILLMAARVFTREGDYQAGIEAAGRLLDLRKPDSLLYRNADALTVMQDFNRLHLNRGDQYIRRADQLLEDARRRGVNPMYIKDIERRVLRMKMSHFTETRQFDKALALAAVLDTFPLSHRQRVSLDVNIALNYLYLGNFPVAETYYRRLLSEMHAPDYNFGVALVNLTHILNEQGRFAESLETYDRYRQTVNWLDGDLFYTYALGNHAIALAGTGRYQEAYSELMRGKLRTDSIYSNTHLARGILNYEVGQLTGRIDHEKELSHRRLVRTWIFAGLAILFAVAGTVVALLLLRRRRADRRRIRELSDSLAAEKEQAEALGRTGSRQLLQIEQLQRALVHIGETLAETSLTPAAKIRNAQREIKELDMSAATWEMFSMHFEKVDPVFLRAFRERHPDATSHEVRLATYIVMNLSNKEIAEMTCRSTRSVESARYRLSKKLGLPPGESIAAYLRSLSGT